jgi:hypothetical protein
MHLFSIYMYVYIETHTHTRTHTHSQGGRRVCVVWSWWEWRDTWMCLCWSSLVSFFFVIFFCCGCGEEPQCSCVGALWYLFFCHFFFVVGVARNLNVPVLALFGIFLPHSSNTEFVLCFFFLHIRLFVACSFVC